MKQKNRSKALVSLPQTAIRVIQLPNLGSAGTRFGGDGSAGTGPAQGDGFYGFGLFSVT